MALFLLAHFLSSAGRASAAQQGSSASPDWSADVQGVIGSKPVGVVTSGKGHEYERQPKASLWFTDNQTVVVTFVTRPGGESPKLSRRNLSDKGLPLHLQAVFLDVTSGKVKNVTNWPAISTYSSIVAVEHGKFVTQSGNELTLYAENLNELKKLQLPWTEEFGWLAQSSPTGENILFTASDLRTHSAVHWIWVETDTLQIARSWEAVQSGWVGISDSNIAMTTCVWFYDCQPNVEVRRLDTDWRRIAPADRHFMPHPRFVNDDLLVLLGTKTVIVRANGELVNGEETPFEGCWWGGVYPQPRVSDS